MVSSEQSTAATEFDVGSASADEILNKYLEPAFHANRIRTTGVWSSSVRFTAPRSTWMVVGYGAAIQCLHEPRLLNARAGDMFAVHDRLHGADAASPGN